MRAGVAPERRPTGEEPRRSCALHRPADEHERIKQPSDSVHGIHVKQYKQSDMPSQQANKHLVKTEQFKIHTHLK